MKLDSVGGGPSAAVNHHLWHEKNFKNALHSLASRGEDGVTLTPDQVDAALAALDEMYKVLGGLLWMNPQENPHKGSHIVVEQAERTLYDLGLLTRQQLSRANS